MAKGVAARNMYGLMIDTTRIHPSTTKVSCIEGKKMFNPGWPNQGCINWLESYFTALFSYFATQSLELIVTTNLDKVKHQQRQHVIYCRHVLSESVHDTTFKIKKQNVNVENTH